MEPDRFYQLVDLLEERMGPARWRQNDYNKFGGNGGQSVQRQVATAFYILSCSVSIKRSRMALNVAKGTTHRFLWRTIDLLASMSHEFIWWPSAQEGEMLADHDSVFRDCIGYVDGTELILKYKPEKNHEGYFSRKKIYGFNMQVVCNDDGRFTYVHVRATASSHDWSVYNRCNLYSRRRQLFLLRQYLLAVKAYEIDRHAITPYKAPASDGLREKTFSIVNAEKRCAIEHAFGVLKA